MEHVTPLVAESKTIPMSKTPWGIYAATICASLDSKDLEIGNRDGGWQV